MSTPTMPFTLLGLAVLCSGYPCGFVYQWVKMRHLIANAREFGLGVCLPKALILTGILYFIAVAACNIFLLLPTEVSRPVNASRQILTA
ncbi:hypothetical protein C8Q72DRAFT_370539 [Fomitopsis betulina]|nr:hypothetical protein C8Q72DRAFT_370539 [Fomitopsis betulina]